MEKVGRMGPGSHGSLCCRHLLLLLELQDGSHLLGKDSWLLGQTRLVPLGGVGLGLDGRDLVHQLLLLGRELREQQHVGNRQQVAQGERAGERILALLACDIRLATLGRLAPPGA